MFKDLLTIFLHPQRTLDKVLFEEDMRRSWKGTWWLVLLSSIATLFYLLMVFSQTPLQHELTPDMDGLSRGILWVFVLIGWVVLSAVSAGIMCLMRILFAWFVRMGLRVSAGDQYPTDPAERRAKGKLLQLIHPYTLSIQLFPSAILTIVMSFVMGHLLPSFRTENPIVGEKAVGEVILFMIVYILLLVISLGSYVYMIVVRVFAIQKIYNVSGARAFWGPFLIYFLFTVIPYVMLIIFTIIIGMVNYAAHTTGGTM